MQRRSFIKIGGFCALGLGALPVARVFAGSNQTKYAANPEALPGKQWAMVVDMQKCWEEGEPDCTDCILACHQTHNVPDIGSVKEEIKWVWTEPFENTFPEQKHAYLAESVKGKPVLVFCNHCANPSCVRVCPTKATYKRSDGIIMMDYHRCIGCRYCMAACPFGARSFNFRDPRPFIKEVNGAFPTREKGVVEKCNLCEERLAAGLVPACVEACKHNALVFGDLDDPESAVRKVLRARYTIQRKPDLGTKPKIYYIVS